MGYGGTTKNRRWVEARVISRSSWVAVTDLAFAMTKHRPIVEWMAS